VAPIKAKLCSIWEFSLTLWTLHGFPRHAFERGLAKFSDFEKTQHVAMNNDYHYPTGNPSLV